MPNDGESCPLVIFGPLAFVFDFVRAVISRVGQEPLLLLPSAITCTTVTTVPAAAAAAKNGPLPDVQKGQREDGNLTTISNTGEDRERGPGAN